MLFDSVVDIKFNDAYIFCCLVRRHQFCSCDLDFCDVDYSDASRRKPFVMCV
jgi:hypothetical protein